MGVTQAVLGHNDLFSGALSVSKVLPGTDFRTTDRGLAPSWRQRAAANIDAIRLSRRIDAEGRRATPEEQERLARFVGFGASDLANSLLPPKGVAYRKGWEDIAVDLRGSVSKSELDAIKASTQYAHYTPETLVAAVWAGARRVGFTGGKVLEPGAGTGLFPAMVPHDLDKQCRFTLVEVEPVTARIARLLQPCAEVLCESFAETVRAPNFDLAIGNPPFSRTSLTASDPAGKLGLGMHDYFIAKSIAMLRPGGIAAFVVSHWTMDKSSTTARQHIAGMADFLGGVRLPQGAMRDRAGTEVVVDLLFFRRREADAVPDGEAWMELSGVPCGPKSLATQTITNEYFARRPDMVLGTHAVRTGARGPEYTVWQDSRDFDTALAMAVAGLPAADGSAPPPPPQSTDDTEPDVYRPTVRVGTAAQGARIKEGSYFVDAGQADKIKADLYERADRAVGDVRRKLLKLAASVTSQAKLYQIVSGEPVEVAIRGDGQKGMARSRADKIKALIPIRDALRDVVRAQENDLPWQEPQRRLNTAYDAFVAAYGPVNKTIITRDVDEVTGAVTDEAVRQPNIAPFRADPDCWFVASIETYDQDSGRAAKGPVFSSRVILPPPEATINGPADALAVVLNEVARVDMARIAEILSCGEAEAAEALGDLVFYDPEAKCWETADAYLSGRVRAKLKAAEAAALGDAKYERNVTALQAAQPADLVPSEITVRLGAPWIPARIVEAFCREVIGVKTNILHSVAVAAWSVQKGPFANHPESKTRWGTHRMHAGKLIEYGLNAKDPQVFDYIEDPVTGARKPVFNAKETAAAQDKLREINERFAEWVWDSPDHSDPLLAIYNERFNDLMARHFDGKHLMLPGASNAITLRDHQKRAIWRIIATGNTYLAHVVGAGKTMVLAAAVMEQRRLGLVRKPMIVVPEHTLMQWANEFLRLYPNARLLVADEHNFTKPKRQGFIARAATGDFDAIIIKESAFGLIPVPAEFEEELVRDELDQIEDVLQSIDQEDKISRKKIERAKEGLREKLKKLSGRKDNMLTLREMGIDQLIVDEAQAFRKLSFSTNKGRILGIDADGSGRAWDLWVKSRLIDTISPNRSLIMSSGTPITNTMGELYTVNKFLDHAAMRDRGVHEFDAWAACFGETKTELELKPDGGYRPMTRFAMFVNVPELVSMFRSFADVVQRADIRDLLGLPRIHTGERQVRAAMPDEWFKAYQCMLGKRIEAIKNRGRPKPGDDIWLSVITDGRHVALHPRLVNPFRDLARLPKNMQKQFDMSPFVRTANDNPVTKLDDVVANAVRIWEENKHRRYKVPGTDEYYPIPGAAQLIFSDIGLLSALETRGFSAYAYIRGRLIEAGVPPGQIAIVHHYEKAEAKLRLVNDINAGRILFALGSSAKMGTGINAQQRLIALHHVDVPWLPSDIEQREGRIERQGNQNSEIEIWAYVTLGSMDATMWQGNERKARFIHMALSGDRTVRRLEDVASQADQFAMAKAMATGDDRLIRKAGLEAEVGKLRLRRSAHQSQQYAVRRELRNARDEVLRLEAVLPGMEDDAAQHVPTRGNAFAMQVGERAFAERKEAGNALLLAHKDMETDRFFGRRDIGSVSGFPLIWRRGRDSAGVFSDLLLCLNSSEIAIPLYNDTSAASLMQRIENRLDQIPEKLTGARARIETLHGRITSYEGEVGAPYKYEDELAFKEAELADVNAALKAEADEDAKKKSERKPDGLIEGDDDEDEDDDLVAA